MTNPPAAPGTVLVTGGGGFVGSAVVRLLVARGWTVRSLSRQPHPQLADLGVRHFQAHLADYDAVSRACEGCDAVVHTAAKAGVGGPEKEFVEANVTGTQSVLRACKAAGVRWLVFTSSPSVVFGGEDAEGADESLPYPRHYDAAYPRTKALAEQMVLGANASQFKTVALRPHLVWGPGDPHLTPRILARARSGRLRIIGKGNNVVDTTYIENAAQAHIDALDALSAEQSPAAAGKAYFITNGEPVNLWDFINEILGAAGLPPVTRRVPLPAARVAAGVMETAHRVLGLRGEPMLTRFVVGELARSHWFNISAAKRDIGYEPRVTTKEGLEQLTRALSGQLG